MRGAQRLLGAALWLLPALALAAEPDSLFFPRPVELRGAIDFWKLVFGRYSTGYALIHDSEDLGLVYGVEKLSASGIPRQRRQDQEAILGRYRRALERWAEGKADTARLTVEERRVWLTLGKSADPQRYRKAVESLRLQVGQRDRMVQGLEMWDSHGEQIRRILRDHGVPDSLAVLPFIESGYNPRAHSHVGASGLWQIMKGTGKPFLRINRKVDERRDPLKATAAAAKILKGNFEALGTWPLAITAYNHGAAGVARGVREVGSKDIAELARRYRGPTFGFASRNFYAEFAAVLELIDQRQAHFGPQVLLAEAEETAAGQAEAPVALAASPAAPQAAPDTAAQVSVLESLAQRLLDVTKQVLSFTTVDARQLPADDTTAIRDVFQVAPDDTLRLFRWGPSVAPAGHPHQGTLWCTVWYGKGEGQVAETFWLTRAGQIVEKIRRQ